MNVVVSTPSAGRLPSRAPGIAMSPRLGFLAEAVADQGRAALPSEVEPGLRMEAERAIAEMERLCDPALPHAIEQWLELVALGVGANAPEPEMRRAHLGLVISTSGDLPRACWTVETRAQFARHRAERGGFWPSDGEIDAFLRPIGSRLRGQLRAMRAIRDKGLTSDRGERQWDAPPTESEMAAVTRSVAEALRVIAESKAEQEALTPNHRPDAPLRDVSASGQALGDLRRARFADLVARGRMLPDEVPAGYRA
jgi:hypothetical protein